MNDNTVDTANASPPLSEQHLQPDISTAAYLIALGHDFLGLVPVGRRFAFLFPQEAHQTAMEYRNGGLVEAQTYAQSLRWLKDQVYSERFRNGENVGQQKQYRR